MIKQKIVLITGVSSGNGKAMAQHFVKHGFTVYGSSRHPDNIALPGVEILALDVRNDTSVKDAVQAVITQAGRLDILVNNAGFALMGGLEETSLDEAKAQFDTNFFGVLRVTNAVLPTMRQQGYGKIINVSSILGLVPLPFMGLYSASKFALEGYSEALFHEVKPFGIHISLLEPGFIKTQIAHHAQTVASPIANYSPWRKHAVKSIEHHIAKAPSPELVAKQVIRIANTHSPRLRYIVGKEANLVRNLRRYLPTTLFNRVWRKEFDLDKQALAQNQG